LPLKGVCLPETGFGLRTSDAALPFGLTGGVASGKSTVARYFEVLGADIIDADRIGHEVIEPGRDAYQEIIDHFGKEVLAANGHIDRKILGPRVFADPKALEKLNAIVHPRIIAREIELAREYQALNPKAVVIVDAALIFESGIGGRLCKVIVAWCRPEQQLERLMAKAGLSREEAERRIKAQMPVEEKRRRADYEIDCSGTLDATYRQADVIFRDLQRIVEGH
jgi:dephospho-CoA kinase